VFYGTLFGASNDGCAGVQGGPDADQGSCQSADVWYSYTADTEVAESLVLSTCGTERSFAIDTVVSVHEGCAGKINNQIRWNDDRLLGMAQGACTGSAPPTILDAAVPMGGFYSIPAGETVVIRVAHHNESVRNNFRLTLLPEPVAWQALVAGAGVLGVLWRRRARG